jgi:GNAT superfamily N-acetyltransferase
MEERRPPVKVRITKLQDAQVATLAAIEAECAQLYYDAGFDEHEVAPRGEAAIARLTRNHDVLVAEADHEPCAYLAWADQAPGVAWLPILLVSPSYQRFGIGTHLLRELGEIAHSHGIESLVTPCWDAARWALSFLGVRGFQMIYGTSGLPPKVLAWLEDAEREPLPQGQTLWWAKTDGLGTIPGLPRPEPTH